MSYLTVIILAFGLSLDSFAVSVCSGLNVPKIKFFQAVKIAIIFSIFQAGMPLIGWIIGKEMKPIIDPIDHWIAFFLLLLVGGKMIFESCITKGNREIRDPLHLKVIMTLGIATSIDALAVGFSFVVFLDKVFTAIIIIGSITFFAAMTGIFIGKRTGPIVNKYAEIIGGLILLIIGIKILIEGLMGY